MFKGTFCFTNIRIVFSVQKMSTYPNLNIEPEIMKIKNKR